MYKFQHNEIKQENPRKAATPEEIAQTRHIMFMHNQLAAQQMQAMQLQIKYNQRLIGMQKQNNKSVSGVAQITSSPLLRAKL